MAFYYFVNEKFYITFDFHFEKLIIEGIFSLSPYEPPPPVIPRDTWGVPEARFMPSRQFGQMMYNLSGSPLPDSTPGRINSLSFGLPQWKGRSMFLFLYFVILNCYY